MQRLKLRKSFDIMDFCCVKLVLEYAHVLRGTHEMTLCKLERIHKDAMRRHWIFTNSGIFHTVYCQSEAFLVNCQCNG